MEKRKNFRGFEQKCFSIVRRLLKTEFPNLKPDNIDVQLADITRFKQSGKAYVVLEGGNQSNHLTIFINIKYREWLKDSDEQIEETLRNLIVAFKTYRTTRFN